jgi:predicted GNAT family N-acyltransferase
MAREIVTSENREDYMKKKLGIEDDVKDIANKHKEFGIDADVHNGKNAIELSKIVVPKEKRGEGLGSKFMEDLTSHADKNNKRIDLSPSKDFGATSVDRLKGFYKQHGFVENKGRNKDYSISHSMYRKPITKEEPKAS